MSRPPLARELGLRLCHDCGFASPAGRPDCPRCGSPVHARKPDSLTRTWAYLITAILFYLPANLLPVMRTDMFGNGIESTILSGVVDFWKMGSWDVALVIFLASVFVPCAKFLILILLLETARRRSRWALRERARLYRFIEFIGYWSMLDVLVVALVAALVQFHSLGTIQPRLGILFFGLVVVMTMLASMSFDPRLIWDAENDNDRQQP